MLDALFGAGAGAIGDYRECAFVSSGMGQFRPLGGASPAVGSVGELTYVAGDRVEVTLPRRLRSSVVAALRAAHPFTRNRRFVVEHASIG